MNLWQKISLSTLRWSLGWLYLYAGASKLANPQWSAFGYLNGAKTLHGLYAWFASPDILPFINVINEWGLLLLGISLILGFGIRLSAPAGMALMGLYYIVILQFPHPSANAYIVDEHVVYALLLWTLWHFNSHIPWKLSSELDKNGLLPLSGILK